ncbi:hypothetical protein QTP70_016835 [Hemibagrus guttatus]|uniref:Cadherin domain-containing protein n=1 Tax=Hemibagrus guttatus TaxID=175788 RepID=A0AAE0QXG6_9TELE|nr:hypothetical protein QTP70_016835 [Hemibagrus guttatus]KAK3565080.1 hypothetical protein QTP86_032505 [Hemibagrus guttatus]
MLQFWLLFVASFNFCEGQYLDNAPIIIQYNVWEEQPAGTRVGRLLDNLRQKGETGSLEDFRIVEHGQALPFTVAKRDGMVSTLGQLDREELCRGADQCELAFSVLYRKSGAVRFLRVRVEVMDMNDHSPVFPNKVQEVEISETVGLRMRIPLDRAEDPDAGFNGLQTYSLSPSHHFALDVRPSGGAKQPELVVIKELDREMESSFELTLFAWDKGNPPKSGSTKVNVIVLDSNDNSPMFEENAPIVDLPEDVVRGTVVFNLHATDPDQGANGEVVYSLSKHAPLDVERLFSVDPQTGAVVLKGLLDFEEKRLYEVDIQAKDRGHNAIPSHCKMQVRVQDVNDNAPRIHITWTPPDSPVATVLEGETNETFLALVMVSDADSGPNGEVQVQIQQGSGPFRLKQIHGDNYIIVTNGSLDRERQMKYNITLLARDSGVPYLSCVRHLTVNVLDENDNAPVFSKTLYTGVFNENNAPGFHILTVEAHDVDLDLSGRVSYSIRESNELGTPTAFFSVHPTSGAIIAQQSLDYEESPTYSFTVEAVDHGYPPMTSSATVLIMIEDVNDNYPIIREPLPKKGIAVVSVPVNAEKGEIVTELKDKVHETINPLSNHSSQFRLEGFLATTILASDSDSGLNGKLQFKIIAGNPSRLFWLDETTGHLYVNTTNATELIGKTFKVVIAVSDMGTTPLVTQTTLEQVSQLLSLLHQGQFQPRPNFRGNKYSHRGGRSGVQDADWLSTKDSGHGESEPGDVDWEAGRDSPVDPLLEEDLTNLLSNHDDVFLDTPDPAWMARLSLPLTSDYHDNLYVPDGLPPSEEQSSTLGGPNDSASFSTFGKASEKSVLLGGENLLSEVSTLFEMLMTQKADAQPRSDILYRLSAAYRRSLGLDGHQGPNEKSPIIRCATPNRY